ncbi:hypothetical protein ACFLRB_00925 [Acidobacteriota bacterium]
MEHPKTTYRIVFAGKIGVGEDLNRVKILMAAQFRVDAPVIEKIFREVPYVLLRNQSRERALKYKQSFEQTGAICSVEIEGPEPVKHSSPKEKSQQVVGTLYTPEKSQGTAVDRADSLKSRKPGAKKSQSINRSAWQSLGGGLVITVGVLLIPFLTYVFHYMLILIHELGHALFGWLFGYPSIPAFDFIYGGGLTSHQDRKIIIVVIVYLLLAGLFVLFRKNHLTLISLTILIMLYTLSVFTPGHQLIILFMGHGSELAFGGLFLYRALSGSAILVPAERPLYAFLGIFVLFMDMRFAHRLMTSPQFRAEYGAAKGGGHWMDFSRIANEILNVDLTTVAAFFLLMCLFAPIAAYLFFRYREYLSSFFKKLLVIR